MTQYTRILSIIPLIVIGLLIDLSRVYGQELSQLGIKGNPIKLQNEMVAKRDINNYYCAAIQFISDMDGFAYDSYNGVVDFEDEPGQDMVFLSYNERVVKVFKTGYEPLKIILSEYGINLQQKEVWQIKLTGDKKEGALMASFFLSPDHSQLFIDGQSKKTDKPIAIDKGNHHIYAIAEGYKPFEDSLLIDREHLVFNFNLDKIKDVPVKITSSPSQAQVLFDEVEVGTTPLSIFYPPGNYDIKIQKQGFLSHSDPNVEISETELTRKYELKENVGFLTINTRPEAYVFLNNEKYNANQKIKLTPQLIQVRVEMPGAKPIQKAVILKRNDDISIDLFPDISTGSIQVGVTPFDALVFLKYNDSLTYKSEGMSVFDNIPIGDYHLKAAAKGFAQLDTIIHLFEGQKKNVSLQLKPGKSDFSGFLSSDKYILIEGGQLKKGNLSIRVASFYITKKEITFKEYITFLNAINCSSDGYYNGKPLVNMTHKEMPIVYNEGQFSFKSNDFVKNDNQPMCYVTWYGADAYAKWEGGKLPGVEEWTYAARDYNAIKDQMQLQQAAWYGINSGGITHRVGTKSVSRTQLYDMIGNVWEWCDYESNSPNRNTKSNKKPVKGGGIDSYDLATFSINNNLWLYPTATGYTIGFRVIKYNE